MLKLQIALDDAGGPWRWDGRRWCRGASWVEPYDHPALERQGDDREVGGVFTVRERVPRGHSDGLPDWPADVIAVSIEAGQVRLSAGAYGVAPLYLTEQAGVLYGSWDLLDLRTHIDPCDLVDREVARILTFHPRYGHDTIFAGVHRLSERSTALYDRDGLELRYPEPALHSSPRTLRPDADDTRVIDAYGQLLADIITCHVYGPATTCVELSGGMDSANVAAALGALHPHQVETAAMIVLGDPGGQQTRRRNGFISQLGLGADTTVPLGHYLPFSPSGPRGPYDDVYSEAHGAMLARLTVHDIRTVFTGIGGDEMLARTMDEWERPPVGISVDLRPWIGDRTLTGLKEAEEGVAPATVVNEMTLNAQACAGPAFLRAGMWPVHPLADPRIIRFGEWLPRKWRRRKRLFRARLERCGCHGDLIDPPLSENFSPVMRAGLRRYGVPHVDLMLRDGSPLIDGGYLQPDGLAAARDRLAAAEYVKRDAELCAALALDQTLRAFS